MTEYALPWSTHAGNLSYWVQEGEPLNLPDALISAAPGGFTLACWPEWRTADRVLAVAVAELLIREGWL